MYSRLELLEAIRHWRALYGSPPARTDWDPSRAAQRCEPDLAAAKLERYRSGDWLSAHTVRNHFGSFASGVEAAGVGCPPRRDGVRWNDGAIIQALRDLAHERGRRPIPRQAGISPTREPAPTPSAAPGPARRGLQTRA